MLFCRLLFPFVLVVFMAACGPEETSIDIEDGHVPEGDDGEYFEPNLSDEGLDHEVTVYPGRGEDSIAPPMDEDEEGEHQEEEVEEEDQSTVEEPEAEAGSTEESTELELGCADDADICRFCGPPVGVVSECPESDSSLPCQVFRLVNQEREAHGLHALEYNGTLAESAVIHAMDLNHCDFFAHDSLDGTTFFQRCAQNGYEGSCTGENIGGGQRSAQAVFDAWMDSPGHRHNMLYDRHFEVGIGYYEGSGAYGRYWVKHFGRP